jgi:lysophospholipase L1-like esterase
VVTSALPDPETPSPTAPTGKPSAGSTAVTLTVFLAVCAGLSMAPVPSWAKPMDLRSADDVARVAKRVFAKPKMTLAHVEEKLAAGAADGRDAPEGQGIDEEEKELLARRDARADVVALQGAPDAHVDQEEKAQNKPARVDVDRKKLVARASPKADHFRAQAKSVSAPGAPLDNPCLVEEPSPQGGTRCTKTALDPFFATLDAIAAGDESARAAAVILGNSLIASDHVTDVVRARLVERFGDAGRGFLLPERLSKVAGRRVRTGEGTPGWIINAFNQDAPVDGKKLGPFGFTGSFHESSVAGEKTTWKTEGSTHARLFYLEHGGQPSFHLEAKTPSGTSVVAKVEALPKDAAQKDEVLDVDLPAGASDLTLVADGKGAQIFGVALERDTSGVIVDTIGVPAASARLYVESADEEMFVRQLALREPSLVVAMLGGNEVRSLSFGTLDVPGFERALTALIQRFKEAAPHAACMIVSPIDAVKATAAGEELTTRTEIFDVIKVQKEVAKKQGCAHFDLFAAMGGAGSLARFKDKGFLSDDLVHPTWRGGDVLGQLFADALLDNYAATAPPPDGIAVARRKSARVKAPVYAGLSFPAEERPVVVVKGAAAPPPPKKALARFFDKLRALEHGEVTRVAIGQFGASHTAGQMWTDRMRQRLGERFGVAGRGFVSVGRESKRLETGGIVRSLDGTFEIADGREVVLGGAVGMSGTKVRLEPGARFAISFCNPIDGAPADGKKAARSSSHAPLPFGCTATPSPGFLQLAWLYTPDMGTAEVAVDGKTVATLSPDQRRPDSDVQFLRLPIDGDTASLEIAVRGPEPKKKKAAGAAGEPEDKETFGPVHLLSVVEERDRPGIILDAVGLPGTTGMTPQRWRQDLLAAEVKERQYDLVVTAWGTNEAGISSLDEATYRHHFERTLDTLLEASPGADCLIIGASDRLDDKNGQWKSAPAHELVERVQRQLAADKGCAFYSLRTAMGGPGSMQKWVDDGLGNPDHVHFTRAGYEKLADLVVNDLMAAYAYDGALESAESEALAQKSEQSSAKPESGG